MITSLSISADHRDLFFTQIKDTFFIPLIARLRGGENTGKPRLEKNWGKIFLFRFASVCGIFSPFTDGQGPILKA
jgi:hypothetical protein